MTSNQNVTALRSGLRLEYVTLGWNVVGTIVVIVAAVSARSTALAAFGLDSLIEIFASVVVVWQLRAIGQDRQTRALRLIGLAFFALAIYIFGQSLFTLIVQVHPDESWIGIGWLAATVVVMLALAWGKRRVGQELGNRVLIAESRVTLVDAILAGAVLVGLLLTVLANWWWADPLAGLVVVYYAVREGTVCWRDAHEAIPS